MHKEVEKYLSLKRKLIVLEVDFPQCDLDGSIEFTSDYDVIDYDLCENVVSYGLWTIQDNILTVTDNGIPIPFLLKILSLTESGLSLEFDGETANYLRDTRPDPIINKPDTTICGVCKLIREEDGIIVEEPQLVPYCGKEFIDKYESSPVTVGNVSAYWVCTRDSI